MPWLQFMLLYTIQGGPEKITHRKTLIKIIPEGDLKKWFCKTLEKCYQKIMNRLNSEMATFCFDDESETSFHRSAKNAAPLFRLTWSELIEWPPSVSPNWGGNELRHPSQILDQIAKPIGLISELEGGHICLSRNPPPHWRQTLMDRGVSPRTILCKDFFVVKSFCELRKNFFP